MRRLQLEVLEPRHLLAANPIVTEFSASNKSALHDNYGATPDWIEIYNAGDEVVDLAGYGLTDDPDELTKWEFPQAILQPGQFLLVYASGLDETDSAGNLHTNFALGADGEHVVLSSPEGIVLSQFGGNGDLYPSQSRDVTHGVAFNSTFTTVVSGDSEAKYIVPSDSSVDALWTASEFDDSLWNTGTASLGHSAAGSTYGAMIQTMVPGDSTAIYARISFQVDDPLAVLGTLRMKFDDGFVAYLNGTQIASWNAPAGVAYDSTATELRPREAAVNDMVINVSAFSNLLLSGENVLAIHLLDHITIPPHDLLLVPELTIGSGEIAPGAPAGDLMAPTPGLPNTQIVAAPVEFSRVGGVFDGTLLLTLTAGSDTIRFTTDGSIPNANSSLYTGKISIFVSTHVRARAFGSNGEVGRVRSEAFTRLSGSVAGFTSDLPIVVLENFAAGVPGVVDQAASFALYETNPSTGRSSLSELPTLTSAIGHHRRGSSTLNQPKANLKVELRDDNGQDQAHSLLGMPSNADWILYAPYNIDRSMVRNALMFDFSSQIVDYASRTRFVEVYLNADGGELDSDDYFGVYVLMENIKIDENRVNIDEITAADNDAPEVSGGYILKFDRPDQDEDSSWSTIGTPAWQHNLVHVDPERSELTAAQTEYIRGYIGDFEQALYGSNFKDPNLGYAAYIDVDSFIDHHLVRVFSRESDSFFYSEYFYKSRDGKLTFGPVWDFDRSAGSEGVSQPSVDGWNGSSVNVFGYGWWGKLFSDPDFKQAWADRWHELRSTVYSDENITATVDAHASTIDESQARNAQRWPSTAPNGGLLADPDLVGWEAEVSHLKNWLLGRAAWIDEQLVPPPVIETDVDGNITLSTTYPGGVIYYTVDGTDPRASGDGVAPGAQLYSGPISVGAGIQINARVRASNPRANWSAQELSNVTPAVPADVTNLRISEVHYNPADPSEEELLVVPDADNNSFEFIELVNIGQQPIDLTDVEFDRGIEFNFSNGEITVLAPGETVLIVEDVDAFVARYGDQHNIAGKYSGRLDSSGEQLRLLDGDDDEIHLFTYDDGGQWPHEADGDGPSIEVIDLLGDYNNPLNWRASAVHHGTPGQATLPLNSDPFITSPDSVNVAENTTAVLKVTATDADLPPQTLTFSIVGGADQEKFTITSEGELTFSSAPDYEAPGDADLDNVYVVTIQIDDGAGGTATQTINVTVEPVNDHSPMITSSDAVDVFENTTAVLTVTATDADVPPQTLTFSIVGGADQAAFAILGTGELTFSSAPDYEVPADADLDNMYVVIIQVDDGAGGTATQTINVSVTPVNDDPVFQSPDSVNVAENTTAVLTVTAADADLPPQTLTFSIVGGADQAAFAITSDGVLTFNSAPDFEAPTDDNFDNVYVVTIQVDDGAGGTAMQTINVSVEPVNDNSPVFTSPDSVYVSENISAVLTVTAADGDAPAQTFTFSILGGADQTAFSITSDGELTFNSAPDYEAPGDADLDNVYVVTIQVDDGAGGTATQTINVSVEPENDNSPAITSSDAVNVLENTTAVMTVTASDADVPHQALTFSIVAGADQGQFTITSDGVLSFNSAPDYELPTDDNGDNVYEVTVQVDDGEGGTAIQTLLVSVDAVNDNSPGITSSDAVYVSENTTTVLTVTAADADAPTQTLTFSIVGGADQGHFTITGDGVLTFNSAPDYEAPTDDNGDNVYVVTIQVDDGEGGTASQTINVSVARENAHSPVFNSPDSSNVAENTTAVMTVMASDADVPPQALTFLIVAGADQGQFTITIDGVLSFNSAPDYELPTDDNGDNVYEVTVQVDDGNGLTSSQTIYVTITDVFEGDYNSDGTVDAADYTVWRSNFGNIVPAFSNPDGSGNGIVDQADFNVWKSNFGNTQSMGGDASVALASLEPALPPQQSTANTVTPAVALKEPETLAVESSSSLAAFVFDVVRPQNKEVRVPERRTVRAIASYERALLALLTSRPGAVGRTSEVLKVEPTSRISIDHGIIGRDIDAFDLALESL